MHAIGVVKNGAIELPPGLDLPNGTEVTVRIVVEVPEAAITKSHPPSIMKDSPSGESHLPPPSDPRGTPP